MDGPKSVTAVFGAATYTLAVSVSGKGRVASAPAGISCTARCSHPFPAGSPVRLQARPSNGFRFAGWSGSCRGKSACTLTVDRNRSATASFKRKRR